MLRWGCNFGIQAQVMYRGWRMNRHRLALHCVFRYLYLGLERAWVMSPREPSALQESCENIAAMKRMNRSEEFVGDLEALRVKYKIKRNFIKLLGQKEKSLYLS